jgi:hypothetical protein
MKVVINTCFGGFSLSPRAVKRLAELNNQECHFFVKDYKTNQYLSISIEILESSSHFWYAFDIPEVNGITDNEYCKHSLDSRPENRSNPKLIQVIEELGEAKSSGFVAELKIIEIPDDIDYCIEEYDGLEHVAEKHRTWY